MEMIQYRYTCVTEGVSKEEWRSDEQGPPTACMSDPAHEIDTASIAEVNSMSNVIQDVYIYRGSLIDPKNAKTRYRGVSVPVVSGQQVSKGLFSFPYNVDMLRGILIYLNKADGDHVEMVSYPKDDPVSGVVGAAVAAGEKVVTISPGLPNVDLRGMFIKFGSEAEEHEIEAYDANAKTVTLLKALTSGLVGNEEVRYRSKLIENWWVDPEHEVVVGEEIFDATGLPVGYVMEVRYHHAGAPAADGAIRLNLTYRF